VRIILRQSGLRLFRSTTVWWAILAFCAGAVVGSSDHWWLRVPVRSVGGASDFAVYRRPFSAEIMVVRGYQVFVVDPRFGWLKYSTPLLVRTPVFVFQRDVRNAGIWLVPPDPKVDHDADLTARGGLIAFTDFTGTRISFGLD